MAGRQRTYLVAAVVVTVPVLSLFLLQEEKAPPTDLQPIAFSHRLHAGDNQIPCLYCHTTAMRSPVAGVPPVQTCYECHRLIDKKSAEMDQVLQYWETKEPIPWTRIHSLPDFVYFTHKRHVRAGVSCQSCHGAVEQAEVVTQVAPLTMGWCVDCHRERSAPLDCSTCHK